VELRGGVCGDQKLDASPRRAPPEEPVIDECFHPSLPQSL